jgi:hypothetical protein
MEGGDSGKRRRGPPASTRKRAPPSDEETEWYEDVVDESDSEERGFGFL